jgi:predicted helicase
LLLTNYIEFRWYVDGKLRLPATLATYKKGKVTILKDNVAHVSELLQAFLQHDVIPISDPKLLASKMAGLCRNIDKIIVKAFEENQESRLLRGLQDALKKTLLPELSDEQFADMFAQTLAYGLFAARINHFNEKPGQQFRRSEAAREIPKTNPFLRKLFETINGTEIEDEPFIGFVDDLIAIMDHADIGAILQHFGRRTGQEDPILHFYETFLSAYNAELREKRGVYYTPEPVVSYIVRSVDHILKETFQLKDGLADRTKIPVQFERDGKRVTEMMPKVLILDPACGTGTFLYAVINHIRNTFVGNAGEWSDFVRDHLLPRIFGFELLMAPYAVAHLKLAMQLAGMDMEETQRRNWAYDFKSDERLNIFLTNSLEMTNKYVQTALFGLERQIAEEANAAHYIKTELPILVVLGNPPYSGHSANKNDWIDERMREAYYMVDGEPLGEKNPKWLQDDYVKFIRFGQWRIEQAGHGILAYITNHGYLDNPTFRGMRQSLMNTFDEIHILDLHGNAKKKETAPDGGKDENVFDIQQGVAIGLFVKPEHPSGKRAIHKTDLYGRRKDLGKYEWLASHDIASKDTEWSRLQPATPFYLFTQFDTTLSEEYQQGCSISDAMPLNSAGIVTARDDFAIGWTSEELQKRMEEFALLSENEARKRFDLGEDVDDWKVRWALDDVTSNGDIADMVSPILYRPFDTRYTFYSGNIPGLICRPRTEVMQHMFLVPDNVALVVVRQVAEGIFDHVVCTRYLCDNRLTRSNKGICYHFPLFIKEEDGSKSYDHKPRTLPNFTKEFMDEFYKRFPPARRKMGKGYLEGPWVSERDIFNYIYAIFHSPTYRKRYAEFLKMDFPRVPITSDVEVFRKLVKLGGALVKLHLMEFDLYDLSLIPNSSSFPKVNYPEKGDHKVERVSYVDNKRQVWINNTQYFEGVPPEVWEFHIGGYQVARKWLDDRRKAGRTLSADDRDHYRKIIAALAGTIQVMEEIDKAIPSWPIE